jgi:hypothetical protein
MVNHQHGAVEGFPDSVCGLDVFAHVLVTVLGPIETSIERVEDDGHRSFGQVAYRRD